MDPPALPAVGEHEGVADPDQSGHLGHLGGDHAGADQLGAALIEAGDEHAGELVLDPVDPGVDESGDGGSTGPAGDGSGGHLGILGGAPAGRVVEESDAAPAAALVGLSRPGHGAQRLLTPAHQIRGGHVPPVDVLVAGGRRVVLEEHVPTAVGGAVDAVGVVDPAERVDAVEGREAEVEGVGHRDAAPGDVGAGTVGGVISRTRR